MPSGKHWPKLFRPTGIPLADKLPLFQSLVLSTLFYGVGTWPALRAKEFASLNRCYLEMCRSLLRRHFRGDVQRISDERVCALTHAPSTATWLHFHRLTYWASFVRLDVAESWALVHQEACWLQSVQSSLAWLQLQQPGDGASLPWSRSWPAWCSMIKDRPRLWKRLLRNAVQRATRGETLGEGWQQCRGMLAKCLLGAGAFVQGQTDADSLASFFCGLCRKRFGSRQQYALHAFKTHGRVRSVRRLAAGTQCPACLNQAVRIARLHVFSPPVFIPLSHRACSPGLQLRTGTRCWQQESPPRQGLLGGR